MCDDMDFSSDVSIDEPAETLDFDDTPTESLDLDDEPSEISMDDLEDNSSNDLSLMDDSDTTSDLSLDDANDEDISLEDDGINMDNIGDVPLEDSSGYEDANLDSIDVQTADYNLDDGLSNDLSLMDDSDTTSDLNLDDVIDEDISLDDGGIDMDNIDDVTQEDPLDYEYADFNSLDTPTGDYDLDDDSSDDSYLTQDSDAAIDVNLDNVNSEDILDTEPEYTDESDILNDYPLNDDVGPVENSMEDDGIDMDNLGDVPISDSQNYTDADLIDNEDTPVNVLKRDQQQLLSSGNDVIKDRLNAQQQQYISDGLSESEIQDRLIQDERDFQSEFLHDAFPNEEVSPEVFNGFKNYEKEDYPISNSIEQPNVSNADNSSDNSDITHLSDIDGWLGDINPNYDSYDTSSPYCQNCGSCAYAVYRRLEGDNDICASAENIGYNKDMEALTGMEQVSMSPEEIESRLLEQGDGAHAIIGIDRSSGAGHWFNAACVDGKVVVIDGQDGSISGWPPDYGDVVNWEMSVRKGE